VRERSYRLAHYEIVLESNGGIWWKAHGGFANTKSGKCFIEGEVLFIGPSETEEAGFLKSEFIEYLRPFPEWDKTKYYCPNYTLYACKEGRVRDGTNRKKREEADGHRGRENSSMTPTDKTACITISPLRRIRQVKGKLGEAFRRCKWLGGLDSEKANPEQ
jgi:hypothetical protein